MKTYNQNNFHTRNFVDTIPEMAGNIEKLLEPFIIKETGIKIKIENWEYFLTWNDLDTPEKLLETVFQLLPKRFLTKSNISNFIEIVNIHTSQNLCI